MKMDKGIVWLASYPKSGNTWLRILLSNYLSNSDKPISINAIETDGIFSSRVRFDNLVGVDSSSLTLEEIDRFRPDVYEHVASITESIQFIKVHDAYTYLPDGRALLPSLNARVVYIVRNPLDVVPSLANHMGESIEETIRFICDEKSCFSRSRKRFSHQLRQKLLSWSGHVESFLEQPAMDLLLVSYEEMQSDTVAAFDKVLRFCGYEVESNRLKKAVAFSDFKLLRQQEETVGFNEKSPGAKNFFNSGKVGSWKGKLTKKQVEQVVSVNSKMMKKLGYL